jgi:5-methyltetrahydropteroyltriglutamate--homocysteine methyltransferase
MPTNAPPFLADHVGSLLRPAEVKAARAAHADGSLDAAGLTAIEDAAIKRMIARQEEVGLEAVTDGELRRSSWHWDFLGGLEGVERTRALAGVQFKGIVTQPTGLKVVGKVGFGRHPMLDHFAFVKRNTRAVAKMCIPSPTHMAGTTRDWRTVVGSDVYAGLEPLFADLAVAYRQAILAFAAAGCTYLQIDDCNFAFLCDPVVQQKLRAQGDDPDWTLRAFTRLVADSLANRPPGLTITMHSCRGNFRSTWLSEGSWEAVADVVFNTIPVDGFFLEYESERAGGFEPLRFMPKNKSVVLGLVSSKLAALEPKDTIKRRIDEAARYVELDRLHLSPQCGFASTEEGNQLTEDEQWRKLAHVVEIAHEVWQR